MSSAPRVTPPLAAPARTAVYARLVLTNLADLLFASRNGQVQLASAYSAIASLVSNLVPATLMPALHRLEDPSSVVATRHVADVVDEIARDCQCGGDMAALRRSAEAPSLEPCAPCDADALKAGLDAASRFVGLLYSRAYGVPCACGRIVEYRFKDVLDMSPPGRAQVTCPACGKTITWFIPRPEM